MKTHEELYNVHLWMNSHSKEVEKHIGEWIAVTTEGIIGAAKTLKQLTNQEAIRDQREKRAVLFSLVPDTTKGLVI